MRKQRVAAMALIDNGNDEEMMNASSDYFSMLKLGVIEHSRDGLRAFLKGYRWMQDEWSSRDVYSENVGVTMRRLATIARSSP